MRFVLLAVALCGCGSPPEGEAPTQPQEPEVPCLSGCVVEADETCDACARKIAKCCYADGDAYRPLVEQAMQACDGDDACAACCNECGAKTCNELIDAGACPTVL